jgi:hypothetical protein
MGRATDKIVGIVKPYADKHKVTFSSFAEREIKDLGRALDAGSLTADQASKNIEKICKYTLDREDLKSIAKALEKLTR